MISIETDDSNVASCSEISPESVRAISESVGIFSLTDGAAKELAEDISYRLRFIMRNALKFMHHGLRQKMSAGDVDRSLSLSNIEPHYGFIQPDGLPFHFSSGGGRDLHFGEEKELDIGEIVSSTLPKLPTEVTLRAHWLSVEGIQPTVPENPPPLSKEEQRFESVDPLKKLLRPGGKELIGQPLSSKAARLRASESVAIKQLASHELSVEQQLYYKEITEACVGSDEAKRAEALQSLSVDPGLHEMLPRMCTFISEGVKVNVVQNNLAFLIYLMRMLKALLDNPTLYLEKYLHELLPSISTCILSRQLCTRAEGNHWALRDFASRLMAQICKTFNTSTNNLQTRVTRLFSRAINDSGERSSLPSLYGAIQGLSELGPEVIKVLIVPCVTIIGHRIKPHLEGTLVGSQNPNQVAASNIRNQVLKVLPFIVTQIRQPPDVLEEYIDDYGYLGPSLLAAVEKARASPNTPVPTMTSSIVPQAIGVTVVAPSYTTDAIHGQHSYEAEIKVPESNSTFSPRDLINEGDIEVPVDMNITGPSNAVISDLISGHNIEGIPGEINIAGTSNIAASHLIGEDDREGVSEKMNIARPSNIAISPQVISENFILSPPLQSQVSTSVYPPSAFTLGSNSETPTTEMLIGQHVKSECDGLPSLP